MDGYKSLDMPAQLRIYTSGLKGGPFNAKPYTPPPITIVDVVSPEVKTAMQSKGPTTMSINDPWVARYPNSKLG